MENSEIRLSGGKLEGSELLSILTPCSSVTPFSFGQLLHHQPWSVKGAFLISFVPSSLHRLNEQGLHYPSLPPTLTTGMC